VRTRLAGLAAVALIGTACTAGAPGTSTVDPSADQSTEQPSAAVRASADSATAVDTQLPAESRTNLSDGARAALTACGLMDHLDLVAGIARLPRAADAINYANIWGDPPYLVDKPAWLVTTKGEFFLRGSKGVDPTCLVIDEDATWLMTGGTLVDGNLVPPLVDREPPLTLPPLAP